MGPSCPNAPDMVCTKKHAKRLSIRRITSEQIWMDVLGGELWHTRACRAHTQKRVEDECFECAAVWTLLLGVQGAIKHDKQTTAA